MKKGLVIRSLAFCFLSNICKADEADKERIRELERKMAELQSAQVKPAGESNAGGLYNKGGRVNPRISNSVLIIQGNLSVGTGFIVSADGKKYVYTAAHVFSGNSKLTINNASGTAFKKFGALAACRTYKAHYID